MKLNNNDDSHNSGLNLLIYNMLLDIESHPAWVCGLKQASNHQLFSLGQSHPAWVCGLKHFWITFFIPFELSHPAWVCGLKPATNKLRKMLSSHTLRGCVDWNVFKSKIAPGNSVSHPAWVCGLKPVWWVLSHRTYSHTLRGCVDWNYFLVLFRSYLYCHTLRGCVDWNITGLYFALY